MELKEKLKKSFQHLNSILLKRGVNVNLIDYLKFEKLVLFVFNIDDIFDKNTNSQLEKDIVLILKSKLDKYIITLNEIDKHILHREQENLHEIKGLNEYLDISGVTVGAHLFAAFLADTYEISQDLWNSKTIQHYQAEINSILRLANDLLDFNKDKERIETEKKQLKASNFIKYKFYYIHLLIIIMYIKHKIKFYFYMIFIRKLDSNKLLKIMESIFDWGFYEMYIKQNSGRT